MNKNIIIMIIIIHKAMPELQTEQAIPHQPAAVLQEP